MRVSFFFYPRLKIGGSIRTTGIVLGKSDAIIYCPSFDGNFNQGSPHVNGANYQYDSVTGNDFTYDNAIIFANSNVNDFNTGFGNSSFPLSTAALGFPETSALSHDC